ncbi:hypothetical protein BDY24DRAFT_403090 [Mrakia frigida]|uniref:uncharacterized protein n=1 Tax=Mrakia frigida TaxID=29902 RepID=UPI003FCC1E74
MDTIPDLRWTKDSSETLDEFLAQKKPSMIQDDGTKPWIWVQKEEFQAKADEIKNTETLQAGMDIVDAVTEKVKEIEADPAIPVRANKSKGTRSKKDLREEAQAEAASQLKALALSSGDTCGKWLLFRDGSRVDATFAALAKSLVDGPLSRTECRLMKVATCPRFDEEHYQHVICLYYPNVYDKKASEEILRTVAENHGIELSSVKSDLYTILGLDSKHESKMRSTIWQPKELGLDKEGMKKLTEAYWSNVKENAASADDSADGTTSKRKAPAPTEEETNAQEAKVKKAKAKRAKKEFDDDSSSDDNDGKPKEVTKKSAPAPTKKTGVSSSASAKKTKKDESSAEEEEEKVEKKAPASKEVVKLKQKAELSGSETEEE